MAEARCGGQDQSMRDVRDSGGGRRHPRGSNASAERNKPDQQPSSQGALSSIRAAIMRTSRSTAQEQQRERRHRRPQITILSAEPMAPSWFPAAPPPSAVQVPPPSYEQVLREKTREQQQQQQFAAPSPSPSPVTTSSLAPAPAPSPSASPSHSTIATQTDVPPTPPPIPPQPTLVDNPVARPALRRPPRPPKPPCPPKPDMSTQTPTDRPPDEEPVRPRPRPRSRAGLRPMSEELTGSRPICSESLMTQPINSCIPKSRSLSTDIVVAQPVSSERVVPQPIRRGHAVTDTSSQTSESVCDQSEGVCLGAESVCVGGQYLQDLLDVFGPESNRRHDNEGDPHGRVGEEEEEEERGASGSSGTSPRPQPRPRRRTHTPTPTQTHTPMQTHTPVQTQTQADASGSPPPQPQPRRRSLPVANTTPQGSPPDQPTHMGTGMPARFLPLRPPPPIKLPKSPNLIRSSSTPAPTNQQQAQRVPKRGPPLPPRPKPGHPLHKSSQKEDINLMDLNDTLADMDIHTNVGTQEDVCPDTPRDVNKPVETPVNMPVDTDTHTQSHTDAHTHINKKTEDSEDKSLEILPAQSSSVILLEKPSTSAMCCVAIFAFRGEEEDELSFSEGDVITLTDYVNDEWGRGYLKGHSGIFPLCFASSPQPHSMFEKVEANQD